MTRSVAFAALAAAALVGGPAPGAQAGFFTYNFTGTVTSVDNAGGFFAPPAAVGAPVTGSFTYTDTPNLMPSSFNPFFTSYNDFDFFFNPASPPRTGLRLVVGGAAVGTPPDVLGNQLVGNDNPTDTFPPFFPVGDSFRYGGQLDIFTGSPLFDQDALFNAEFLQFAFGNVFLVDPTGAVFDSQALPVGGLPLSGFTRRYGVINLFDDNFEQTGLLVFEINAITLATPVPVPPTVLLALGGTGLLGFARRRTRATA